MCSECVAHANQLLSDDLADPNYHLLTHWQKRPSLVRYMLRHLSSIPQYLDKTLFQGAGKFNNPVGRV